MITMVLFTMDLSGFIGDGGYDSAVTSYQLIVTRVHWLCVTPLKVNGKTHA